MGQHQTAIGLKSIEGLNWKGKRVLDIGCGNGELSREIINITKATELVGIDLDSNEIEKARSIKDVRLSFLVADASTLPFEDESFDIIFCNIAFQQFSDKEKSLKEMCRILRINGEAVINFIEEKSEVLNEVVKIMREVFNIDLDKKGSKILRQEFNKIAKQSGFKIIKSQSKLDTFFFRDMDIFLSGYKPTIEAKTKRLSPEQKEIFMQKLNDAFLSKQTKEGIPDSWHIVVARLVKLKK
jgi:ubiquinone/menaquinone biosynthesis C-methylase UbiE